MDPLSQLTALPMHQQAAAVTFIAYVAYRALRYAYRRLLTLACMSPLPYGARAAAQTGAPSQFRVATTRSFATTRSAPAESPTT